MAQLNTRGTLTRTRWDYFEHSNGVAFVYGSVTTGPISAYFANNSTGATAIDIYTLNWSASVAAAWSIAFLMPPLILTPIAPTESHIFPLIPDAAQPPGLVGMYTANAGAYATLQLYTQGTQTQQMAPIMGSYFATLPPGWAISVTSGPGANPVTLAMTVWYQYVTDNISPAP